MQRSRVDCMSSWIAFKSSASLVKLSLTFHLRNPVFQQKKKKEALRKHVVPLSLLHLMRDNLLPTEILTLHETLWCITRPLPFSPSWPFSPSSLQDGPRGHFWHQDGCGGPMRGLPLPPAQGPCPVQTEDSVIFALIVSPCSWRCHVLHASGQKPDWMLSLKQCIARSYAGLTWSRVCATANKKASMSQQVFFYLTKLLKFSFDYFICECMLSPVTFLFALKKKHIFMLFLKLHLCLFLD